MLKFLHGLPKFGIESFLIRRVVFCSRPADKLKPIDKEEYVRRERILARPLLAIFAAFGAASSLSAAPILFVGDAGISGIQRYDLDGNLLGSFGPSGATGVALDGMGHVFFVQPANTESVISTYDASNNPLNS